MGKDNMGINDNGLIYHKVFPNQDIYQEFLKTQATLLSIFNSEIFGKEVDIQFINYGDTQLVYVVTIGSVKYAVLVGQPITKFGTIKKEFDNLRFLSIKNGENIVTPTNYFALGFREFYIAPYIEQARCIANQKIGWGLYIPEPEYRFEKLDSDDRFVVNSSMIALLIKMFNSEKNLGIASCKIGGGDFILEKEWSNEKVSHENTLKRMKLIAARELISIGLNEYIDLIRSEFSKATRNIDGRVNDDSIKINLKSHVPMSKDEIEYGIELGKQLRKKI